MRLMGFCSVVAVVLLLLLNVLEAGEFHVLDFSDFQQALSRAQNNGENDVIYVEGDMNVTTTLTYRTGNGDGGHQLRIVGNGHVLNGMGEVKIMSIETDTSHDGGDAGGDVFIEGLVFSNGSGGALYVSTGEANVSMRDCDFIGNHIDLEDRGAVTIEVDKGNVEVENCSFSNNRASDFTGGALNVWITYGKVKIANNSFRSNSAGYMYSGGGVAIRSHSYVNATIVGNLFSNNTADKYVSAGGLLVYLTSGDVVIYRNVFVGNRAADDSCGGAALIRIGSGRMRIEDNIFKNNVSDSSSSAGAVNMYMKSGEISFMKNTIVDNISGGDDSGGGVLVCFDSGNMTVGNNVIVGNKAGDGGCAGGLWIQTVWGIAGVINNTFVNNVSGSGSGGVLIRVLQSESAVNVCNNIVWDNIVGNENSDVYIGGSGHVKLCNNDMRVWSVEVEGYEDGGNINDNPLFVDPDNGDFHLQANSPCIDAGRNNVPGLPDTDFEGDPRIMNRKVDIGADEFRPAKAVPAVNGCGLILLSVGLGLVGLWKLGAGKRVIRG